MHDVEVISNYVNLMTRMRSATIAAHSILAGVDVNAVLDTLNRMQQISEGKELQGLRKDMIHCTKTFQLFNELFAMAEEYMGHED